MLSRIDQSLKERLVGLSVLILLGIVFIPWVLDGKKQDFTDSESTSLELPNPEQLKTHEFNLQTGELKVVNLEKPDRSNGSSIIADSRESLAASSNENLEEIENTSILNASQTLNTEKVTEETQKVEKPASNSVTSDSVSSQVTTAAQEKEISDSEKVNSDPIIAWAVQIGSYGDKQNAETQVKELVNKGYRAFLSRFNNDSGKVLYRVRVGPESDRNRADKLAERLKQSGYQGKVLTHP